MERDLSRYIWRHARWAHWAVFLVVVLTLPLMLLALDLPRQIVNEVIGNGAFAGGRRTAEVLRWTFTWPAFLGGQTVTLFKGFPVDARGYLLTLCAVLFGLVLVNMLVRLFVAWRANTLGERLIGRLRLDLFSGMLEVRPENEAALKASEPTKALVGEVDTIGQFMGRAVIRPFYCACVVGIGLIYILLQNVWLAVIAAGALVVEAIVIGALNRSADSLDRDIDGARKALTTRVAEMTDSLSAVRVHGTADYERTMLAKRIAGLAVPRRMAAWRRELIGIAPDTLRIVITVLFLLIGGFLAFQRMLNIGQLVAIILAFREMPQLVEEMSSWQALYSKAARIYARLVAQFPREKAIGADAEPQPLPPRFDHGAIELDNLTHIDRRGVPLLEPTSVELPLPDHIALVGGSNSGARSVAGIIGHEISRYGGTVRIAGAKLGSFSASACATRIAYVGPSPVIFPGTIRDNVIYGLRKASGGARDLNLEAAGATDADGLDDRVIDAMRVVGYQDEIYRLALDGFADKERQPALIERIVELRQAVQEELARAGATDLVAPFDPNLYNEHATIGENLLFGVPLGDTFREQNLATNPFVRSILEAEGLTKPLSEMGLAIAETMVEIFSDVPPGHSLFERFSFIAADDLPSYAALAARWKARRRNAETGNDRDRLLALPLTYIEPRHRLGLMDDGLRAQLLSARNSFMRLIPASLKPAVEFYDPAVLNRAAPLRDNLLFGRAAYGVAHASETVAMAMTTAIKRLGLERDVLRLGLDARIGPRERMLTKAQKTQIDLARCLVKRPDILVLDDALGEFDVNQRAVLLARLREAREGRTLLVTVPSLDEAAGFASKLLFDGSHLSKVIGPMGENSPLPTGAEAVQS